MKRCPKNCKSCSMCNIKTSNNISTIDTHVIYFCFECLKFGVYGDSYTDLYESVQWEKENA